MTSSAVLEMFQMTAGRAPTSPAKPTWHEDAELAYRDVTNLMLDMHYAAVEVNACRRRALTIAAKLDNPAIDATPEQRGAAEARHWSLMQTAKRLTDDEVKRPARAVSRKFNAMSDERKAWAVDELARSWSDSPIWPIVRVDPLLMKDPVWVAMVRSADLGPVNPDEVPF